MSDSKFLLSFFLFFFFTSFAYSFSTSFNNSRRCTSQQSLALLLFKQTLFSINDNTFFYARRCQFLLGFDYHPVMMNWNTRIDCCNWDGVTCNHFTGDVIGLDLSCGMLQGTIHPNTTLFNLPHLQTLNLAYNDFSPSQLPHGIGKFSNSLTHLNISECGFTGQIPSDIFNLRYLEKLDLSYNEFTGQIPSEISLLSKLVSLDLSWNGEFDLKIQPHVLNNLLRNCTLLRDLSLAGVDTSYVLPTYLNISSSLKSLDLGSTYLQGKLPDNIFNLQYLEKLDLSHNYDLTGPLPKVNTSTSLPLKWLSLSGTKLISREIFESISHLKSMNYLELSQTDLSGEMPNSIGHLKSLNTLILSSCGLMGPLPKSLVNLTHLTTLSLSHNMLNGTLPSWLFTLPSLENIFLGVNMFYGSLPSELFALRSLKQLILSGNQFVGKIDVLDQGPTQQTFQQLVNLTHLDLSYNNFKGEWELDTLLSSLTSLLELDLSDSGFIIMTNGANRYVNPDFESLGLASCNLKVFPESIRAMRKLQNLDLSDNKIHGHIPDWVGEIRGNELFELDLSHNFITGLPQFQWDLYYLNLQSNKIQGPFPPWICNMSNLWFMDMSDNSFVGVIPQCLGNISSSLRMIDLGNNFFHGAIPSPYKVCGELEELILNGNQFEGEAPSSLSKCQSMIVLDLHSNKIQGPFPPSICNMTKLQYLRISDNSFSGVIPQCIENVTSYPNLWMVDLGHNNFHGIIPNTYNDCGGLQAIILNGNQLEGDVPGSLSKCQSLEVFDMGNNHLNGTFPSWLGDLPLLKVLDLKLNNFHGPIQTSSTRKVPFPSLQVLDLSHNGFVGHLPQKYFQSFNAMKKNVVKRPKKPEYLSIGEYYYSFIVAVKGVEQTFPQLLVDYTIVDLSNNRFESKIPDIIGNLTSLIVLNLAHNILTGRIPHALGNLLEIESLDLSCNQLTGEIPQSLVDLTFLEFLNLSQNHLMGRIPNGKQFDTFEVNSFGGNPQLCGLPLPKRCEHPHKPQLETNGDTENGFTWRVVMLGYGCGTLLGLVMGYVMLSTGRPKWFNAIADAGEHIIQKRKNKRRYVFIGK